MAVHGGGGGVTVVRQQGGNEGFVLDMGMLQAVFRCEEALRAEGGQALAQAQCEVLQRLVAGASVDQRVEFLVQRGVRFCVALCRGASGLLMNELDALALRRRGAQRAQLGAQGFQFAGGFEEAVQVGGRHRRHREAAARQVLDQPGRGELPQRIAHRAARDAEARRDRLFVQAFARLETAQHDFLGQAVRDGLGQRFSRLVFHGLLLRGRAAHVAWDDILSTKFNCRMQ
ncbi:hypothetical protein FQZ97_540990 [compost metagenome]